MTRQRNFCANARAVMQLPPPQNPAARQLLSTEVGNAVRLETVLPTDVVTTLGKRKKEGGIKRKAGAGEFGKHILEGLQKLPNSTDPNLHKGIVDNSLVWLTRNAKDGNDLDAINERKQKIVKVITQQDKLQKDLQTLIADEAKGLPDIARSNRYQKLFQDARQLKLDGYLATGHLPAKADGTGQSVCTLIKSGDSVVFAFKPVDGEASNQQGHTLREAVASRVFQEVRRTTGLDFGVPIATMAQINGQTGVVIDGVQGKQLDPMKLQGSQNSLNSQLKNNVQPKEFHKLMFSTVLMSNLDAKFENVFLDGNDQLIPFDNGGTFPTDDAILGTLGSRSGITRIPGECYLREPGGRQDYLPLADQPLDPSLTAALLAVDVKEVMTSAQNEATRLAAQFGSTIDPSTLARTGKSLQIAQALLQNNPQITAKDFMTEWWKAYSSYILSDLVERRYRASVDNYLKDPNADSKKKQLLQNAIDAVDQYIAKPDLKKDINNEFEQLDRFLSELAFLNPMSPLWSPI